MAYNEEDLVRLHKLAGRFRGQVSSLFISSSGDDVTPEEGLPAKCYLHLSQEEALTLASHLLRLVEANDKPRDSFSVNLPRGTYVSAALTTKHLRALKTQCEIHMQWLKSGDAQD